MPLGFFFSLLADSARIISATRPGGAWKSSLECLNDVDEREAARLRMVEAAMRMGENRLEVTRLYVGKTELYVPNRSFSSDSVLPPVPSSALTMRLLSHTMYDVIIVIVCRSITGVALSLALHSTLALLSLCIVSRILLGDDASI